MKAYKTILFLATIILSSCGSINVLTDYDDSVDFSKYRTYAFYKPEIDKAKISDLDKKRILRAIEYELEAKGFVKSTNPDLLVGIFTKSKERVNVNQNNNFGWGWGFGWGWNPWIWGGNNNINVNQYTEGTLFIDFIDKEKKELIWQGIGTGALRLESRDKKEERINEFVKEIISKFPPKNENN